VTAVLRDGWELCPRCGRSIVIPCPEGRAACEVVHLGASCPCKPPSWSVDVEARGGAFVTVFRVGVQEFQVATGSEERCAFWRSMFLVALRELGVDLTATEGTR
jgi:hypothetical protein